MREKEGRDKQGPVFPHAVALGSLASECSLASHVQSLQELDNNLNLNKWSKLEKSGENTPGLRLRRAAVGVLQGSIKLSLIGIVYHLLGCVEMDLLSDRGWIPMDL